MLTIRPFQTKDLEDLYAISLATGHAGGDASQLYVDPKLIGHIYSAPYACLEPRLALVVEDREGVAGFAVGVVDTSTWEQRLEQVWWPSLRERYPMPPRLTLRTGPTISDVSSCFIDRQVRLPLSLCDFQLTST